MRQVNEMKKKVGMMERNSPRSDIGFHCKERINSLENKQQKHENKKKVAHNVNRVRRKDSRYLQEVFSVWKKEEWQQVEVEEVQMDLIVIISK
jgi:hypothetical protein